MTLEQLKAYLVFTKEQLLRLDGAIQALQQLIQLAEQEAAKLAEVKVEE